MRRRHGVPHQVGLGIAMKAHKRGPITAAPQAHRSVWKLYGLKGEIGEKGHAKVWPVAPGR